MTVHFVVPGLPVAQPRQRYRVIVHGGRAFVRNYTPTTHPANVCKVMVQQSFAAKHTGPPFDGPLELIVIAVFPRPRARIWKRRPMPAEWYYASRCDADNVLKTVMDSLTGLAWRDDGQVARAVIERRIAAGDEQPHMDICVTSLAGRCPTSP